MNFKKEDYETGDILLFSDKTFIPSKMIEFFTDSKYSHVGMVLKDPLFIDEKLNGLYILESTGFSDINDVEDNEKKLGVQIRELNKVCEEYNGAVFHRKLITVRDEEFYRRFSEAHEVIHNKPYDVRPVDWIKALIDVDVRKVNDTKRFFCSALVAYVYDKLGLIKGEVVWDLIRPVDFGTENIKKKRLEFNCVLKDEEVIKGYESYCHYLYNTY